MARGLRGPLFWVALLLALGVLARHSGLTVNLSSSLPRGLYLRTREPLLRGSLVLLCLPAPWAALALERGYLARGPCPGGTEPLGKQVVALSGDEVEFGDEGLRVNGRLLPKTVPLRVDSRGRPLPRVTPARVKIPPREILVFASHPRSFDSRYFGPIPRSSVITTVRPLFTFEGQR